MKDFKSDFNKILPEDCKQFNIIAKRYLNLLSDESLEAFEIMKKSWSLSQRWSELQASARKIMDLSEEEFSVTDFKNWCYQRYRQMQLIHESCRVIWRSANEQEIWLSRQGLTRSDLNVGLSKTQKDKT